MFKEEITVERQAVVKHFQIDSVILLVGLLPGHVLIALAALDRIPQHPDGRIDAELPTAIGSITNSTVVAVPASKVEETLSGIFVIADNSVRSPDFQEINHLGLAHPLLGRNHPSGRNGREETVTLAGKEVLGTVVAGIEVKHIFLFVGICGPPDISHISRWYVGI